MANNLYDYLNQFNLGQVVRGVPGVLQGAADTLNRYRIGLPGGPFGTRPLGQRPVVNPEFMRPDYSGAGERARRFQEYRTGRDIPGANTDYSDRLNAGSVPVTLATGATAAAPIDPYAAQNRAYQQERARVEAMVKANPDMQKQEIADARAKVRDQGMAIWAAANPTLAKKVKPGQSGYEVIQNELNAGQVGPVMDLPFDATKPFSPTPIPPEQLNVTYQGASPVPIPGATPIVPTAFGRPEMQFFETFRQAIAPGPQFQGSPLASAPETTVTTYKAELLNPLGGPLPDGAFRNDKARQIAEFYKRAQLGQ